MIGYLNHDGVRTDSIDGSGLLPSVGPTEAVSIARWLKQEWPMGKIVDVGAGVGHLGRACKDAGLHCYSLEGSSAVLPHLVCDATLFSIADLAVPLPPTFHRAFDVVTAFEFFEHIPRHQIQDVFAGVRHLATHLVASIHVANEENEFHKTIQPFPDWERAARLAGITLVERPELQQLLGVSHWTCSIFVEGTWT